MSTHKHLMKAAAALNDAAKVAKQADELTLKVASLQEQNATLQKQLKAAAAQTKVASAEEKAALGQEAAKAAQQLKRAGLISDDRNADLFASGILDHKTAITKIAQLAQHVNAPRMGEVVVDEQTTKTASADETYEARALSVLQQLNLG